MENNVFFNLDIFLYKIYALNVGKSKNKLETLKAFIKENRAGLGAYYEVRRTIYDKNSRKSN